MQQILKVNCFSARQLEDLCVSLKNSEKQDAFFYIPKDVVIVDYAQQIEVEREHYIDKQDYVRDILDRDPDFSNKNTLEEEKDFEAINSVATDKIQLELDFGKEFALPEEPKPKIYFESEDITDVIDEDIPAFEKKEKLKQDINNLSRIAAKKMNGKNGSIDWNLPHKEWLRRGGKAIDQETLSELLQRREWLYSKID